MPLTLSIPLAQARVATLSGRGEASYSNLGAALLGQALAAASATEYARLVQERVFRPLGMTGSRVPVTAGNLPTGAPVGHSAAGAAEAPWTMNGWAPAGGIRSTPADLVRYARALLDGAAGGEDALTPRWAFGNEEIGYAWITHEMEGRTMTWHDGQTGGFASIIVLDRARDRAVIIFSNTSASVDDAGMALIVGDH